MTKQRREVRPRARPRKKDKVMVDATGEQLGLDVWAWPLLLQIQILEWLNMSFDRHCCQVLRLRMAISASISDYSLHSLRMSMFAISRLFGTKRKCDCCGMFPSYMQSTKGNFRGIFRCLHEISSEVNPSPYLLTKQYKCGNCGLLWVYELRYTGHRDVEWTLHLKEGNY